MPRRITHGQLVDLLAVLGFVEEVTGDRWRSFQHCESGSLIILADRHPTAPAIESEVASVRRHLVANGFVEEWEFDDFFEHGPMSQPR